MNIWTKKRIMTAFTELVEEEGYDHLTVEAIAKRADVSKATFYRYFKTKTDLLDAHYRDLYDAAFEDKNCRNLQDLFTLLLKQIRENPGELSMFDTVGYDSYREFIYKYTYTRGKAVIEKAWGRKLNRTEELHVALFCGGGARIMEEWACGKYRDLTAEEAGKEIASMVGREYFVKLNS